MWLTIGIFIISVFLPTWSFAESPLSTFIQTALEYNLGVKSERLSLSQKEIELNKVKKEEFNPQITVGLTAGQSKVISEGEESITEEKPTVELTTSLSRPHPLGGKLKLNLNGSTALEKDGDSMWSMGIESEEPFSIYQRQNLRDPFIDEKLQLNITRLNLEERINELIYEVVTSYSELQKLILTMQVKERELGDLKDNLEIAKLQFEKGIIPEIDILQIDLQRSIVETEIEQLKKEQKSGLARFYHLVGSNTISFDQNQQELSIGRLSYDGSIKSLREKIGRPAQIPSLLKNTPQVRIKEIEIEQAKRRVKGAESLNLPVFIPSFTINNERDFREEIIKLSVSFPFYDGGVKKEEIKSAKILLQQQEITLTNLFSNAKIELTTALDELTNKEKRLLVQEKNVEIASQIYEIARIRHQRGLISSKDLLDHQMELFGQQKILSEQQIDLYLNYVLILKLTGVIYHAYQEGIFSSGRSQSFETYEKE